MTSRYLAAKIAFLVLALFTVTYQCAAQCLAKPCHELGTKAPPCHRQNPKTGDAPVDVCKAPLLLAEEVRIHSGDHPELLSSILLPFVFSAVAGEEFVPYLGLHFWQPPGSPVLLEFTLTTPLRI